MRLIAFSDLELTTARMPVAEIILKDLFSYVRPDDKVVFIGDMWREYNGVVEKFAKKMFGANADSAWFVVGNHDREVGADRLSAAFDRAEVFDTPHVINAFGTYLAFLPAPDRAAFGASRAAEGRKARDAALSDALEAALISLETQIGPENLGRAILFFHGAVSGEEVANGQIAAGLTWSIPGNRLSRWGLAIGGHIHKPGQNGNTYSVGGIANWTFSDRAEQFRALVVDTETLEVSEIPLLRALVPIEFTIEQIGDAVGIRIPDNEATGLFNVISIIHDLSAPAEDIVTYLLGTAGVNCDDTLNLKIHVKLPPEQLALLPSNEEIEQGIADAAPVNIQTFTVCREPVGLSKVRLQNVSARSLTLSELFWEYVRANSREFSAAVKAEIEAGLDWLNEYYKPMEGNSGFRPHLLKLHNISQWHDVELDFDSLLGAVSITGRFASGKSNLPGGAMFAVWKKSPTSDGLENDLRRGATEGFAELTFGSDREYEVRRALEAGKGGVTCKTEFFWLDDAGKHPVCEDAKEIDRTINAVVSSYEYATSTIWHTQDDIDGFVKADPAEHRKLFLQSLNLDRFKPLNVAASDKAETFLDNNKVLEAKVDELEAQLAADGAALEAMAAPEALQNRIEAADKLLALSEEKIGTLRADKETWVSKNTTLHILGNEKLDLEKRLRTLEASLAQPIEDIGARPEVPAVEIGSLEATAAMLKADREELLEEDAAKRKELAKAAGEVEAHKAAVERIGKEIEMLEAQLKGWEAGQGKLETPACLASGVHGTQKDCPAWLYYSKADQGKELREKLEAAVERKRIADEHRLGSLTVETATKEKLTPISAELAAIAPKLREIEVQIGDYRNALHATELWDEKAKGRTARLEQDVTWLLEKKDLEGKLDLIRHDLENVPMVKEQIGTLDRALYALNEEMGKCRTTKLTAQTELQRRADLEAALEAKRARQAEHRATIAGNNVKREAWETLAAAMHESGIPHLLMEQMLEAFEREANEILAPAGMTLQVPAIAMTKKGEARDKLKMFFTDSRGQFPLKRASGAQRTFLGVAGTVAHARISAQFWGSVPEFYFLDEGWDRVSVEDHDIARAMIGLVAQRFTRFVYVTHVEALAECADVRLRVVAENGKSRLVG